MKKKVKAIILCLIIGLGLSSCALFGERKKCPAYSQNVKIEKSKEFTINS